MSKMVEENTGWTVILLGWVITPILLLILWRVW
jgi:hypothetical protein